MKQTALIWKKSVYENNFHCPICGNKLYDPENNKVIGENTGFYENMPDELICLKCRNYVAHIKEIEGDYKKGLNGKFHGNLYD